jgi:protein TonB
VVFYSPSIDLDKISEQFDSTTVTLVKTKSQGDDIINAKEKKLLAPTPPKNTPPPEPKPKKKECCKKEKQPESKTKEKLKLSKLGLFKPKETPKEPTPPKPTLPQVTPPPMDKKNVKKSVAKRGGRREVALFFKEIKKSIAKNRIYPKKARRRGVSGRVKATFTIEQNGTISNITLKGRKIFFYSAKRAIKKIEPIDTKNAPINLPLRVSITLKYRLR